MIGDTGASGSAGRVIFVGSKTKFPPAGSNGTSATVTFKNVKELNSVNGSLNFGKSVAANANFMIAGDTNTVTKQGIVQLYTYTYNFTNSSNTQNQNVYPTAIGNYYTTDLGLWFYYQKERVNCYLHSDPACAPFGRQQKACNLGENIDISAYFAYSTCLDPIGTTGGICVMPLVPTVYTPSFCGSAPAPLPCSSEGTCNDTCLVACVSSFDEICNGTYWDSFCASEAYDTSYGTSCYQDCYNISKRAVSERATLRILDIESALVQQQQHHQKRQTGTDTNTDTNSGTGSSSNTNSGSGSSSTDTNTNTNSNSDTNTYDGEDGDDYEPLDSCYDGYTCEECVAANSNPNTQPNQRCAWIPDYAACIFQSESAGYSGSTIINTTSKCSATFQASIEVYSTGFFVDPSVLFEYADVSNVQYQLTSQADEADLLAYTFCLKHPALTVASAIPGVIFCETNASTFATQGDPICEYFVLPALDLCPGSLAIDENFLAVGFPDNNSVMIFSFDNFEYGIQTPWIIINDDDSVGNFGSNLFLSNAGNVTTLYVTARGDKNSNLVGGARFYRWNRNTSSPSVVVGTWNLLATQIPSINYPLGSFQYDVQLISSNQGLSLLTNGNADGTQWKFTVFKPCPVGQHFFAGQCTLCPAGQYKNLATIDVCTLCPPKTYNSRIGANSSSACLPCTSSQYCPAGSISPTLLESGAASTGSYVLPDLQSTNALQFETTFFVTVWPYLLALLLLLTVLMIFICIPCRPARRVQGWITRGFLALEVPLYFPGADLKDKTTKMFVDAFAGCFSILTVVSMLLVVIFGFIVFSIGANNQIQIVLHTQREITSSQITNYNKVDSPAFQMNITLVSYSGSSTGLKPALCNGKDNIKFVLSGCTLPDGSACSIKPTPTSKTGNTLAIWEKSVTNGVTNCKIILNFKVGTTLSSDASFAYQFFDTSFYASHVLFNLTTKNDNSSTADDKLNVNWGNGAIYDYITAPAINDVLRKDTELALTSTINYVEQCFDLQIQTDNDVAWLQTTQNNCTFDPQSLKEFSPSSKTPTSVQSNDFYAATNTYVYALTVSISKSALWKNTQRSLYVNIGQIIVWIILFAFSLVSIWVNFF